MKIREFFTRIFERVRAYDDTHNFNCDVCAREVFAGERICAACYKKLPFITDPFCPLCGRKVNEEGTCLECRHKRLEVDIARAPLLYEGEAARLVLCFKRGRKYLYRTLAELMLPMLKSEFPAADGLVFVPMTEKAERKRGYNQSRLVAEELARRSGIPVFDVVTKTKEAPAQKTLGREEREKNLEGLFRVVSRTAVKDKLLVIIDDVLTTGATVNEIAAVLKRAGARAVYALTFTSVKNPPFGKPPKGEKKKKLKS